MKSFRKTIVEEPLQELSKGTLKRYVKKAAETGMNAAHYHGKKPNTGSAITWLKRKEGVKTAVDKLAKEEVEQIDEAKRHLPPSKYLKRYGKRFKGIRQATSTLTKEEVELTLGTTLTPEQFQNLTEASRSFSLSASDKHVHLAQNAEHEGKWGEAKRHWKNAALASIKHDAVHKRDRADKLKVRGLTMRKEDVEQIDELSKGTLRSYVKKASEKSSVRKLSTKDFVHRYRHISGALNKIQGVKITKKVNEAIELHTARKDALVKLLAKAGARALPPKKKSSANVTADRAFGTVNTRLGGSNTTGGVGLTGESVEPLKLEKMPTVKNDKALAKRINKKGKAAPTFVGTGLPMSFAAVNHEAVTRKYKKTKKVKNPVSNEYVGSEFPTQYTMSHQGV